MNAHNDNIAAKGLRRWWLSPPRSGLHQLIAPWEYRHLRGAGVTRIAGGSVAAGRDSLIWPHRDGLIWPRLDGERVSW